MPGAQQMGEGPASIDVGHQIDLSLTLAGYAHVDDIAGAQVDLRRTTTTLDDPLFIVAHQAVQSLEHDSQQAGLSFQPRLGADIQIHTAHDDHLDLRVSAALE